MTGWPSGSVVVEYVLYIPVVESSNPMLDIILQSKLRTFCVTAKMRVLLRRAATKFEGRYESCFES